MDIQWLSFAKIGAYYLFWFVFYVGLIQSTYMSIVSGVSNMFYGSDTDDNTMLRSISIASVLWAFFILINS